MSADAAAATCPSCSGSSLVPLLHWPSVPVNAALFPATRADSLAIPRRSFRLVACETCGLLFNADHDDVAAEYSARCIETQAHSPHHRAFADALARDWVERHALRGARVVEIGCGHDAGFLRTLVEHGVAHGTCVDPACSVTGSDAIDVHAERFGGDLLSRFGARPQNGARTLQTSGSASAVFTSFASPLTVCLP